MNSFILLYNIIALFVAVRVFMFLILIEFSNIIDLWMLKNKI